MKRSEAARLIEKLRQHEATHRHEPEFDEVRGTLLEAGVPLLEECPGEAHSNGHIDNCSTCAPRWGWVGEKVRVT